MNRIYFFLIVALSFSTVNAQGVVDGVRYANDDLNGTARFNAMAGAFGALGGDLSAMATNPAGSAVFLDNSFAVSMTIRDRENTSTYFNGVAQSIDTDFSLNQVGGVFVFDNQNTESNWKKFTLGLEYNNSNNFDDDLFIAGTGNNSIAQFFVAQAQGIPLDLLQLQSGESISDLYAFLGETQGVAAQNAFLGYQGFIIDPLENDPGNTAYISNVAPGSFNQKYSLLSDGYSGKYTLNLGAQYTDDLFFGINLNSHLIDYDQSTYLFEANTNAGSTVQRIGFENNLSVLGAGFSAQVGAIAKIANNLRLGVAYDTPTWYEISEETTQYLETRHTFDGASATEIIDPRVVNVYADYNLRTPGKLMASAAYVFGQRGLLSFEYSYKDYSNVEFSPENDAVFAFQNAQINNILTGASTYRLGGEYRFENISLRGGYRYEESPYSDGSTVGDLTGYSAGLGYNFGNYFFDISYAYAERDQNQQLYSVGLTDRAFTETQSSNIVFTLGFSL
ncbi:MAG: transporter [Flavobacteriaceae bacterium]|nr:transporter [Flavobacteriaceae bacterium]